MRLPPSHLYPGTLLAARCGEWEVDTGVCVCGCMWAWVRERMHMYMYTHVCVLSIQLHVKIYLTLPFFISSTIQHTSPPTILSLLPLPPPPVFLCIRFLLLLLLFLLCILFPLLLLFFLRLAPKSGSLVAMAAHSPLPHWRKGSPPGPTSPDQV